MRLVTKALLAAAALGGVGLAAAPASARTVVTFGIGAPVYPAYYYAPRPYYPAYYGGYYAPPAYGYYAPPPRWHHRWHEGWRREGWRHEGWRHDRGWHRGW